MIEAYPLCWPADFPRSSNPVNSRFKTTLARSRDFIKEEIRRIGGIDPIISTNIPLNKNGELRADWQRSRIDDAGAAVYFTRNNQPVCLCCDHYTRVWENLYAVGRTIEALRQIDRDGVSDFLNRSFTGFKALPEETEAARNIWDVLGLVLMPSDVVEVKKAFREKSKIHHPDKPTGNHQAFTELQDAYSRALQFYNA